LIAKLSKILMLKRVISAILAATTVAGQTGFVGSGATWSRISTSTGAGPLYGACGAYFPQISDLFVFAGDDGGGSSKDSFNIDVRTGQAQKQSGSPEPRIYLACTGDPGSNLYYAHGGIDGGNISQFLLSAL
jgi:hypothetical protein